MKKMIIRLVKCFVLAVLVLTVTVGLFFSSWYWYHFSEAAGHGINYFVDLVRQAHRQPTRSLNILLLGLDRRGSSNTLLTDTIMVAAVRPQDNKITFLSLPRDLWLDNLKTKINALYYYGQKENFAQPTVLLAEEISKITGLTIDNYVLVDFSSIAQLVDNLDGVEVTVKQGFEDCYYPTDNGHGDVKCVRFVPGRQVLDGEKALQFIRSRKSDNLVEGTDQARVIRQQQLVQAIAKKTQNPRFWLSHPEVAGRMIPFWEDSIQGCLDLPVVLGFLDNFFVQNWQLSFVGLPEELLVNPPVDKYGQWVWEPAGGSWDEIRDWVKHSTPGV